MYSYCCRGFCELTRIFFSKISETKGFPNFSGIFLKRYIKDFHKIILKSDFSKEFMLKSVYQSIKIELNGSLWVKNVSKHTSKHV